MTTAHTRAHDAWTAPSQAQNRLTRLADRAATAATLGNRDLAHPTDQDEDRAHQDLRAPDLADRGQAGDGAHCHHAEVT